MSLSQNLPLRPLPVPPVLALVLPVPLALQEPLTPLPLKRTLLLLKWMILPLFLPPPHHIRFHLQ